MDHRRPDALDPELVGSYPATAGAGGGLVWDEVEAAAFSSSTPGSEASLALVLQREYLDEPQPGEYRHVHEERVTEWPVEFLHRPRRTARTIPDFLAPEAAPDRLNILRGLKR